MTKTGQNLIMAAIASENIAAMADDDIPKTFDVESRARIRSALKAYMKSNNLGVPTLWERVLDADPKKREISLPTLQRFVAGKHRTSDMAVEMCARMLRAERFAIPDEPDSPTDLFGHALGQFLSPNQSDDFEAQDLDELVGTYRPAEQGFPIVHVKIGASKHKGVAQITEEHVIMAPDVVHRYDGAMVCRAGGFFGLVRNRVTAVPRVYWLSKDILKDEEEPARLSGQVSERPFKKPMPEGERFAASYVQLQKTESDT